jgi:phosphate/sulfate permease
MLFLFWITASIVIGYVASTKGRSGLGWFLFSLFLSPLLGGFAVAFMPRITRQESLKTQLKNADQAKKKGLLNEEEYLALRKKIIES